ncbi:MAG: hypothetical protein ACFFCD_12120 [Promethearchaeota archaeon]
MEDLSKQMDNGLICPRCGYQMYILSSHGIQRCPRCGFWKKTH